MKIIQKLVKFAEMSPSAQEYADKYGDLVWMDTKWDHEFISLDELHKLFKTEKYRLVNVK